jgi:hypothetical protein
MDKIPNRERTRTGVMIIGEIRVLIGKAPADKLTMVEMVLNRRARELPTMAIRVAFLRLT